MTGNLLFQLSLLKPERCLFGLWDVKAVIELSYWYGWCFMSYVYLYMGFPGGSVVKNLPANEGDVGLIPGSGRSPGEGNGNLLQYPCLGNPMDRGAYQAIVRGVTKSQTWLSGWAYTHSLDHYNVLLTVLKSWEVYSEWSQQTCPCGASMLITW